MKKWILMGGVLVTSFIIFLILSCGDDIKPGYYGGENIFGKVKVFRYVNTKAAALEIDVDSEWKIFSGKNPDEINFSHPILEGYGKGNFNVDVENSSRDYFQIITPNSMLIAAERELPMSGGFNFRDIGGYPTTDGKYVKWGKFIRSGNLNSLNRTDLIYLSSIPITTVADFRGQEEITSNPDNYPSSVKYNYHFNIPKPDFASLDLPNLTPQMAIEIMKGINVKFVTDSACIVRYREFFNILQDESKTPVIFHCSGGKDRIGMASALILLALGVDEETVIGDYMLSNNALDNDKYDSLFVKSPILREFLIVKREYIEAGLTAIKSRYGSIENFLRNELFINLEDFRKKYLNIPEK
ncbi:MAG: tyrosine-protein phosphatase [Culturomica sp.]|jgi:protein-tyrosine phosphatase|nr:tyrosine-protein phosphatase [Culturomica sp.]